MYLSTAHDKVNVILKVKFHSIISQETKSEEKMSVLTDRDGAEIDGRRHQNLIRLSSSGRCLN